MDALVTVVVPVYNVQFFLKDCVDSLIKQTYSPIEIILVDDGSDDGSDLICDSYSNDYSNIFTFHLTNSGVSFARNYGLERANGEYICFVDQDDIVKPDMFELLINDLEQNQADFAQGGVSQSLKEEKIIEKEVAAVLKKGTKEYQNSFGALIVRGDVIHTSNKVDCNIWNKIYRLDFLRENHMKFQTFLDYEDDWLFVIEAMKYAKAVTVRKQVVYIWRTNEESESRNRIEHDKYLENFYEKHCRLREFLLAALGVSGIDRKLYLMFEGELQKETLLWGLSNETGRGIENRTILQSTEVMKNIVKQERSIGIKKGMLKHPLPISIYGQHGLKKAYYVFRDVFLTFLLLNHLEKLAVILNKKMLHGRWHN